MIHDDGAKPVKKPIPLPRKTLLKVNKNASNATCEDDVYEKTISEKKSEGKNFIRDDWKSASGSFVSEKKKIMKNEVNKLEKSVRSIIAKRKISCSKSNDKYSSLDSCESVSDGSVFLNISFNSPLETDDGQNDGSDNSSDSSNEDMDEMKSLSPPAYPPPELPDESLYDQMRSFDYPGVHSCNFIENEHSCGYSTTSSSKSLGSECLLPLKDDDKEEINVIKKVSSFFLNENSNNDNRYQIIYDTAHGNDSKVQCTFLETASFAVNDERNSGLTKPIDSNESNHKDSHKSVICMFDPLKPNKVCKDWTDADLGTHLDSLKVSSSNTFAEEKELKNTSSDMNSLSEWFSTLAKDTNIIPPNLKEGEYGKIKKIKKQSEGEFLKILPKNSTPEPPPIPPRPNMKSSVQVNPKILEISQSETEPNSQTQFKLGSEFQPNSENLPDFKSDLSQKDSPLPNSLPDEKTKPSEVIQWSSLKRVAKKVADNIEHRKSYLSLSGRKSTSKVMNEESVKLKSYNIGDMCTLPQNFPKHSGIIYRPGCIERWGVLSQRKLTLFANKDSPDVKETVPMDNVLSIQATQNKISDTIGIHCFEISLSSKTQPLLFGVPSISERHIWMRKLLESIGPGFSAKLSTDYFKAGWCYAKENISCDWTKHCILVHHRTLYLSCEPGSITEYNLRKARSISLRTEGFLCDSVTEKGPQMLVDLQGNTLYLQMDFERETKAWESILMDAALKNGPSLNEQQLTKDDVPTIVEKCLNFVHTHGCFSEGIYRRSGSNRTVNHLLAGFRYNAWSIQLNRDDCTEFDVSSVLKRFFRDLPEPLLLPEIQGELGKGLGMKDKTKKIEAYKSALSMLPKINYLTARRLLGHLHFIDKQKEKNLMGAENLAAIWGPTILQVQEQVSLDSDCFKLETLIVNDLIVYYKEIFEVKEAEVEREMKILRMLESYHANSSSTLTKKPSGELKIWVYLNSANNADDCYNVSVSPQKTAEEICTELSSKMNEPAHTLCLEEIICDGRMTRPMNHSERVLDTVLRWSYWDETDRKDNCLVLKKNEFFQQVVHYAKYPVIVSEELKFADQKSKTFKSFQFEFSQAKLICYKDKLCSQKVGEWKVEDIVWYFGHEAKRTPHSKWSITFIEKNSMGPRSKDKPYFGYTICGSSEEQKLKLTTAMLVAQYSKDILPTPNLMD